MSEAPPRLEDLPPPRPVLEVESTRQARLATALLVAFVLLALPPALLLLGRNAAVDGDRALWIVRGVVEAAVVIGPAVAALVLSRGSTRPRVAVVLTTLASAVGTVLWWGAVVADGGTSGRIVFGLAVLVSLLAVWHVAALAWLGRSQLQGISDALDTSWRRSHRTAAWVAALIVLQTVLSSTGTVSAIGRGAELATLVGAALLTGLSLTAVGHAAVSADRTRRRLSDAEYRVQLRPERYRLVAGVLMLVMVAAYLWPVRDSLLG